MLSTGAVIFLALVGVTLCMNLNKVKSGQENVLYFEPSDHQATNQKDKKVSGEAVVCPDGSECPDGNTCCRLATGDYGCCPLPDAVCCSDFVHCCPNGYRCDVGAGTCIRGTDVLSWLTKVAVKPVRAAITCDDDSECSAGNTCCQLASGQYGCCPLSEAVCCSDHVHCCPKSYTCDVSSGTCTQGSHVLDWLTKTPSKPVAKPVKASITCQDGSECPDGNTCCELASGQYGCCPLEQAVCCSDHVHCCPQGYTCDVSAGTCTQGNHVLDWLTKTPSKPVAKPVNASVTCQDGSECPDDNTCCELASGQYGCCPLEQAVCCSDHVHCCPQGYTCDVSSGTCTQGSHVFNWLAKTPSKPAAKPVKASVTCQDGSECPDDNTSCELASGQYGCCPLEQAVCCSDHVHCCPQGYTCDVSAGTCTQGSHVLEWLNKTPSKAVAKPVKPSVICQDGTECPAGNTCCELASGQYGCCPLEKAVCCSDNVHCCPQGYTCDVSAGTCTQGSHVLDWLIKKPSKPAAKPVKASVTCQDDSECPDGNTCCELASGQYGCCPLEKAVCCSDHVHCCPQGYTCDVSAGTCTQGSHVLDWLIKTPSKPVAKPVKASVTCQDGSECPDGNTCCELASGQYGCCPLEKAVCCSDHVHCCPQGYTCDVSAGTCTQGSHVLEWLAKTQSKPAAKPLKASVTCQDGSECPDGNTCCELASGQYGCCPLEKAVCCSDNVHCCPQGYTCDVSAGTCTEGSHVLNWLTKTPSKPAGKALICKDGSECSKSHSCCDPSTGQSGCCPLEKAVCCSDGLHCCPEGYTCNNMFGTCDQGVHALAWVKRKPSLPAI